MLLFVAITVLLEWFWWISWFHFLFHTCRLFAWCQRPCWAIHCSSGSTQHTITALMGTVQSSLDWWSQSHGLLLLLPEFHPQHLDSLVHKNMTTCTQGFDAYLLAILPTLTSSQPAEWNHMRSRHVSHQVACLAWHLWFEHGHLGPFRYHFGELYSVCQQWVNQYP